MTVPDRNGIYGFVPDEDYHADRGSLSCSGAKLLLPPSCPAKFREAQDNPPPPKREYSFGHLVHKLVLGAGADIAEIEAPDYRTKDARDARDKAHANNQIPALTDEVNTAREMARVVHQNPDVGYMFTDLEHAVIEHSVYADDPVTGVRLRCRPDNLWLGAKTGRAFCLDYKTSTTANPDELVRKFWQFGYFLQSFWYTHVLQLAGVADGAAFCFVVSEKTPPYIVTVVEYDAEAMAEGARQMRRAIDLYARCRDRNEWPGYTSGVVSLSLPPWAFHQPTMDDLLEEEQDND